MAYELMDLGTIEPSPLNQRVKLFKELSRLRGFDDSMSVERAPRLVSRPADFGGHVHFDPLPLARLNPRHP